jgi:myo-inositol 2-dehydrogenase / D-chiro-inositol 1-dehydrogenase
MHLSTISVHEQHHRAGSSLCEEASGCQPGLPVSGRSIEYDRGVRGDEHHSQGPNPVAAAGGCGRPEAVYRASLRNRAVAAGKHVYCEKPMGVDVAQAKRALEIGKRAEDRVSVEVGFQIRCAPPFVELVRRIHDGALGKIGSISAHYNSLASSYPDRPGISGDELRIRNWLWDRTLSGDIIVEQNIHVIDICNWILRGHPLKAFATGGRNIVSHFGDTWDNYQVAFTYPDAVHVSFSSTQFGPQGWFDVSERVFGSLGISESPYSGPLHIVGNNVWEWARDAAAQNQPQTATFAANGAFVDNLALADPEKEKSFIESITSSKFHNQAAVGVESALSAMLARMAGRLGREVTWDELLAHGERFAVFITICRIAAL